MTVFFFFAEPENFYDCYTFLSYGHFLLCCSGFITRRGTKRFIINKWTILYTVVFAALLVLGLSYSIYAKFTDPRQKSHVKILDNMTISITFIELFGSMLMFILTVASALWYSQRHMELLKHISVMDQCLIQEFGANMNYSKILRKNIVITLLLAVLYLSTVFWVTASITNDDFWLIFMGALSYALLTSGPHLCGYVHANLAEMLKIRFRLLQCLLNRDYLIQRFPDEALRERRLHSAVDMVKALHMMIREISTIFMMNLLTSLLHDMTLATSEFYLIFEHSVYVQLSSKMIFFLTVCLFGPCYKVLMGPIYCQMSVAEGAKCLHIIQQIDVWFPKSKLAHHLVTSTMYWRLAQKFEFKTGVNIVLNKSIIAMVVTVVVNYLMILTQFGMTQSMESELTSQTRFLNKWFGFAGYTAK